MDLYERLSKPRIVISGGSSRLKEYEKPASPVLEEPEKCGRDYGRKYQAEERELYQRHNKNHQLPLVEECGASHGTLSELESMTNCVSVADYEDDEKKLGVYDRYTFDKKDAFPQTLSVFKHKSQILDMIEAYKVVIIKGVTGCGKTTQIPQYILDHCREKREYCNIIVTQPRRLAAISVAKRVSKERGWDLGTVVGYQIGQQKLLNEETCITYCTTGVLLQKLVAEKTKMMAFSHVILDEVHERDSEMDFLLIVIRRLLNTSSRNVKVILMSATVNTDKFSEYFYTIYNNKRYSAVVLNTEEKCQFEIRTYFLDDLMRYIPEANVMVPDGPDISRKGYMCAVRLIQAFDKMDRAEAKKMHKPFVKGSVLIFLPGLHEIEELTKFLDISKEETIDGQNVKFQWWIIALHSSVTADEQDKVFKNAPNDNQRKIILSTNIAESSITVPDIKYVIDFCLTKVLELDPKTNLSGLKLCWASQNSLKQRAGRVGRVMDGRVYRLITEECYQNLDEDTVPEMLRCPLDQLVLQAKLLDMGTPEAVFALAMDMPDLRNIKQTVLTLKEIGALLVTVSTQVPLSKKETEIKEVIEQCDGDLTLLGRVIAKLPMDVRLGKLIYFGNMFNVLDECIIMACAMSVKNLFSSPFQEYVNAYNSKLAWANSTCSDCIAFLNAYTLWRKTKAEGVLKKPKDEEQWGKQRFVQIKILREVAALHLEVLHRLKGSHLITEKKEIQLTPIEKNLFLKLAIAAAFYPNYFFRGFQGGQVDEKQAVATLCGRDPYTTVYLQGMPTNQPGILYKKSIEKHFEQVSSSVKVAFNNGSKVLLTFDNSITDPLNKDTPEIPGKIDLAVYRAVKMRQLKPEIRIPILNPEKSEKLFNSYLREYEEQKKSNRAGAYDYRGILPAPWNTNLNNFELQLFEIHISYIETPNRFWAQSTSQNVRDLLSNMTTLLNTPENLADTPTTFKTDKIYAALFEGCYYRCRILSHRKADDTFDIFFVDYGNTRTHVPPRHIKALDPTFARKYQYDTLADLAIRCSLAKIQPLTKDEGKWSPDFINYFKRMENFVFIAKVYSIVSDVVNLKLYEIKDRTDGKPLSFNRFLIKNGYVDEAEETFLSKQDHEERANMKRRIAEGDAVLNDTKDIATELQKLNAQLNTMDIDSPRREECSQEAILKGPYSPLEMKIFSATNCSLSKLSNIERNSVNSVLLDTNPQDSHERMVVAAHVTINQTGEKLSLKDTTVMPCLPGLPAFICLLFSPMVELRCDADFTRLTGALCGLGYYKNSKQPFNSDNDIEIVFDVEINLEEVLTKVNRVRYWLNMAASQTNDSIEQSLVSECKKKLYEYITDLLWHKWETQELVYNAQSYKWGLIPDNKLLIPVNDPNSKIIHPAEDFNSIYRLIWGISLDGNPKARLILLFKNLKQLKDMADGISNVKNLICNLCQVNIPNSCSAKLHLKSTQHKARAKKCQQMHDELEE